LKQLSALRPGNDLDLVRVRFHQIRHDQQLFGQKFDRERLQFARKKFHKSLHDFLMQPGTIVFPGERMCQQGIPDVHKGIDGGDECFGRSERCVETFLVENAEPVFDPIQP